MAAELLVLQHIDREGPEWIAEWAAERNHPLRLIRPDRGDALPNPELHGPALAVVLGGPMGVNDRHQPGREWLEAERQWLEHWLRKQRPVLGICLGAQLICAAAGGTVEPLATGMPAQAIHEVGFGAIGWRLHGERVPWLASTPQQQMVLHWHGDRCCLPEQALVLASSLHCIEQAFQLGNNAVGLQFHLELSEAALERWIAEDLGFITAAGSSPARLMEDAREWGQDYRQQGQRLLTNLLNHLWDQT